MSLGNLKFTKVFFTELKVRYSRFYPAVKVGILYIYIYIQKYSRKFYFLMYSRIFSPTTIIILYYVTRVELLVLYLLVANR